MADGSYPPVSVWKAGFASRCPRCGKGPLYGGFLRVAERCTVCELQLGAHDAGDGPAVFIMFIVGAIVVGLALWLELSYAPAYWIHVVLWAPLTVILCLALLRPAKALMIALQYRHKIGEFDDPR